MAKKPIPPPPRPIGHDEVKQPTSPPPPRKRIKEILNESENGQVCWTDEKREVMRALRKMANLPGCFLDNVQRVENPNFSIADGEYAGKWSGYRVVFSTPAGTFEGKSTDGIRGRNVPCIVRVKCNQFKVEAADVWPRLKKLALDFNPRPTIKIECGQRDRGLWTDASFPRS